MKWLVLIFLCGCSTTPNVVQKPSVLPIQSPMPPMPVVQSFATRLAQSSTIEDTTQPPPISQFNWYLDFPYPYTDGKIQSSTNLIDWQDETNCTIDDTGWTIKDSCSLPSKYFRAVHK